jgi:hypothetical protein
MYASTNVQGDIIWEWAHQNKDQHFHHKAVKAEFNNQFDHKFQHQAVKVKDKY